MKEQFNNWAKARDRINGQFQTKQLDELSQEIIAKLHSEVFNHKYFTPCKNCPKTWIAYHEQLEKWWHGNRHIYERLVEVSDEPVKPRTNPRKGKPLSEETKAKIRATKARNKAKKLARDTKTD